MIPTREQIEAWNNGRISCDAELWMHSMLTEISNLRAEVDMVCRSRSRDMDAMSKLRADLDRANTEAALAKASDPVREEDIKAWRDWALGDIADPDLYDDCFVLSRAEIDAAVSLMRSAGDGKALLRELRAWICGEWSSTLEFGSTIRILDSIDEMLARPEPSTVYSRGKTIAESAEPPTAYYPPAPVEQPDAAVPDHVPDAGKMVPVLYWLEDGKFARAMLVGKDLLVVDLTFGDGPSVVGKPEWFDAGYVAAYGGLVPESATRGKEPGQWDYGVASIAKPSAVPDDTRELVAQLADLVAWAMPTMNHHKGVKAIAAKLRGGA